MIVNSPTKGGRVADSSNAVDSLSIVGCAKDNGATVTKCPPRQKCRVGKRRRAGAMDALLLITCGTIIAQRVCSVMSTRRVWVHAPIVHVDRVCPTMALPVRQDVVLSDFAAVVPPDATPKNSSVAPKPKICLTTLTDEGFKSWRQRVLGWRNFDGLRALTFENKQQYADKHGYVFTDASGLVDPSRPPSWSKILAVQRLFLNDEACDWVMWMDADTVIMNSNKQLESFLPNTNADLLVTADHNGYNAGVWLLRRTAWSAHFLQTWWNMSNFVKPVGLAKSGDNDALNHLLRHVLSAAELAAHVRVPPGCTFNAYAKVIPPGDYDAAVANLPKQDYYLDETYYHRGDLLAHMAGVDNKIDTIQSLLALAV